MSPKWSVTVLALALLGCHVVRGDFGIPSNVQGATSLEEYASSIVGLVEELEYWYGSITLDGPVPAFNEAAEALKAVYQPMVDLLLPIAQSVESLAGDDDGPVETVFDDADTKIVAMLDFITNTSPALLATVQTKVSIYVRDELLDIVMEIEDALGTLKSSLTTLRGGVINARTAAAANGGVYTSAIVRSNVQSSQVFAVQSATLALEAAIPYSINSAQQSVESIDDANRLFAEAVSFASGDFVNELWEAVLLVDYQRIVDINGDLETLVNAELPLVTERLGLFAAGFSALVDPLGAQYDEVSSVFAQIVAGTEVNVLNGYKTLAQSTSSFATDLLNEFFAPIEPVVRRLAEILVERGPYAQFCYTRHYPKVFQYLLFGEGNVSYCLDTELGRVQALLEALLEVIYELRFFVEDTSDHLHTCYRVSQFDEELANECLQEYTDFSGIIPCTAIKEYAMLLQLLCKEVDSIRFRLWACFSRGSLDFPFSPTELLTNIETCRISGPTAPA